MRGLEALLRWQHPKRGGVPPAEFIPAAEDCGLIERIGQWVLDRACAQAAAWQRAGLLAPVAVNLSPLQFAQAELAPRVLERLAAHGLAPALLQVEITETALMHNTEVASAALAALQRAGVGVALDDFGTGYSSLAYLTRMPIATIKIDRAFVGRLHEGGHHEAIVRAVLAMARSLSLRVVAEGVETAAQAATLAAMGCHELQGWHFSRAVPAAEVPALLARRWDMAEMLRTARAGLAATATNP